MADKKPLSRMNKFRTPSEYLIERFEEMVGRVEEMLAEMKEIHSKVDQLMLDADVYKRHYKMWDGDRRKND